MPDNTCEIYGSTLDEQLILARFRYKGDTIYVENTPAWVCKHCGEQYFDAPIYKRLEAIAEHRDQIQRIIAFPLAEFDTALV
jgi:YgiT-type zinc finger domain-containing protein